MNFKRFVSVQCAYCHKDIPFYGVKPRFNCPHCATTLGSNRSAVDAWAVVIYLALAFAAWFALFRGSAAFDTISPASLAVAVASIVVALAAYIVIAPRALDVFTDTWSRDAPAQPAGRKRKVLTYTKSGPGAASGQKRSS